MQGVHASRKLLAERIGHLAGAVRRLIVEHQHRHAWNGHQVGDQDREVVFFVVGRDQDECLHRRPSNRSVAICSDTRPTSSTITENINASTAPFGMRAWYTKFHAPYAAPTVKASALIGAKIRSGLKMVM